MLVPLYGLTGYPLDHSFSPEYFRKKFEREKIEAIYKAFPLEQITALPQLLAAHPELRGLNVTTPHKQAIIPFLAGLSAEAAQIGAVNCVALKDGHLFGHNTDWTGFRDSLKPLLSANHHSALVLGAGGASLAICFALKSLEIPYLVISRRMGVNALDYSSLGEELLASHPIIINTTTLGTQGKGLPPIPYQAIGSGHLLYDLVYNPAVTPFLEEGIRRGAQVKNGLEMLELQAEASWQIWQS